jgi:hypothetical protein
MGYVCATCGTQFELNGTQVVTQEEAASVEVTLPVAAVAPAPKKSRQKKAKVEKDG